jgi:Uma2 family endonuclease
MATSALIPVSEYLQTVYEPDCDYVDGEVQERNLGEEEHSDLQAQLLDLLRTPENKLLFRANPELRVQVSAQRFRVPDVCVRRKDAPSERIVRTPPLLCIEILSPEDRIAKMRMKIRDYFDMGVQEVWIVDPQSRSVSVCRGAVSVEHSEGSLTVPGTSATIQLGEIFGVLDEYD